MFSNSETGSKKQSKLVLPILTVFFISQAVLQMERFYIIKNASPAGCFDFSEATLPPDFEVKPINR